MNRGCRVAGIFLLALIIYAISFVTLGLRLGFSELMGVLLVVHPLLFIVAYFILKKLTKFSDPYLMILVGLLTGIGLVILYRIDVALNVLDANAISARQLVAIALGLFVMIIVAVLFRDSRRLESWSLPMLIGGLILMGMTLVFGKEAGGSRAWLVIGSFNLQPSELFKVFMIIYLASYLGKYRKQYGQVPPDWWQKPKMILAYFGPLLVMETLALLIAVVQRDLGMALLYFGLFLLLLYDATSRFILVVIGSGLGALGLAIASMLFTHVHTRLSVWLHPWADPTGTGYQMVQSLLAIRSGGLSGQGLGNGLPLRIPAAHTDFIFSVWAEEMGLVGSVALLLLFFFLVQRSLILARLNGNPFLQLLAVGIAGLFGLQILVIVGGTVGLLPLTGVTLPFLSYGGSSIISSFLAIGLLTVVGQTVGGSSNAGC
ncbi:MAG TPA: FtsW/RodA/SpoVE family cell cycle protein [Bacillota bacterium]|nr:FtsW/RodA/SpoVE family cell cycle protein [Bacillota bacterium]